MAQSDLRTDDIPGRYLYVEYERLVAVKVRCRNLTMNGCVLEGEGLRDAAFESSSSVLLIDLPLAAATFLVKVAPRDVDRPDLLVTTFFEKATGAREFLQAYFDLAEAVRSEA